MSDEASGVVAEVQLIDRQRKLHSVGPHRFLVAPRIGEEIAADFDGEAVTMRVVGVVHIGDPIDAPASKLKTLPTAALHIVCEKK
jgi:hypothetical protein